MFFTFSIVESYVTYIHCKCFCCYSRHCWLLYTLSTDLIDEHISSLSMYIFIWNRNDIYILLLCWSNKLLKHTKNQTKQRDNKKKREKILFSNKNSSSWKIQLYCIYATSFVRVNVFIVACVYRFSYSTAFLNEMDEFGEFQRLYYS